MTYSEDHLISVPRTADEILIRLTSEADKFTYK